MALIKILLHEQSREVPEGTTLFALRDEVKPDADIVIFNGAVVADDRPLSVGDEVHLIRRGQAPAPEELEALLVARHTPGVHAKIRGATVGIAGLGGLGSTVAIALVRCGIGRLILVDFDVVEPSNLNRQQYFIEQIGKTKCDAMAEILQKINPYVALETGNLKLHAGNVAEVFSEADVIVEAFDNVEGKAMLIETVPRVLPETPLVGASGLAGFGPGNTIQTHRFIKNVYLVGDLESAAGPGMGLMAPRVGIAAAHQANCVLRLLLGEEIQASGATG